MKKVIKSENIPLKSTVANGFGRIDYQDIYSIAQQTGKTAKEISKELLAMPGWVSVLFRLRNRIVGVFGLKTDRNTPKAEIFFTVIENREDEIVMGEVDKHLNFRASILKDESGSTISLITVVHYNNVWGKVYFFPVKPFHKIIMRVLLKRYLKR
ncbi:MAG: DUF2867 domain-containing protein [Tannerellaceae bacterium]|jgi:hypothetical protein|nr:DUF2867 domain-containing protein [Tannerellaceae bacterium]